jgi:hypothetical protein
MLCGQMSEYDVEFNFPSQTLECGIVKYTTVNSRGRIEHKTREVVAEEKITSSQHSLRQYLMARKAVDEAMKTGKMP